MTAPVDRDLVTENAELRHEIDVLRQANPDVMRWFYARKSHRQSAALDVLCRKLTTLHFQLREIHRLGRGLTRDEYLAARDRVESEQHRERIAEPAAQ